MIALTCAPMSLRVPGTGATRSAASSASASARASGNRSNGERARQRWSTRTIRPRQRGLGRWTAEDRVGDLLRVGAAEHAMSADQLVREDAEHEHVACGAGRLADELLRSEIGDAVREPRRFDRLLRHRRREHAEVGDLDVAVGGSR